MSKTRVVHVNDNVDDAVYIGRAMPRRGLKASKWANPYKIGAPAAHWGQKDPITREGALFGYATDLRTVNLHLMAELPELRGKALACWCRHDGVPMTNGVTDDGPDNRCHGDILVNYLDLCTDDELREMAREEANDRHQAQAPDAGTAQAKGEGVAAPSR